MNNLDRLTLSSLDLNYHEGVALSRDLNHVIKPNYGIWHEGDK